MKKRILRLFYIFLFFVFFNNISYAKDAKYYNVNITTNVNPNYSGNIGFTFKKMKNDISKIKNIKDEDIEFTSSEQYLKEDGTLSIKLREGTWIIEETFIENRNYIPEEIEPVILNIKDDKDVYIENKIKKINLTLEVKDENNKPINDLEFELYRGSPGNSKKIKKIKTEDGKIEIKDIPADHYYLTQMEDDRFIQRYDAINNANNILRFSLDENMKVNTSTSFNSFVIYDKPEIDKTNTYKEEGYPIGEEIPVSIKIKVPQNIKNYSKFLFKEELRQSEEFTNEAEIVNNSISIKEDSKELNKEDYEMEIKSNSFYINFSNIEKDIEISYRMKLKENAEPTRGVWNESTVVYNNSPDGSMKDIIIKNEGNSITTYRKIFNVNDYNKNTKFYISKKENKKTYYLTNNYSFSPKEEDAKFYKINDNKKIIINGVPKGIYYLNSNETNLEKKFELTEYSHLEEEEVKYKNLDLKSFLISFLIIGVIFFGIILIERKKNDA